MKTVTILINGTEYTVEPTLHKGIYSVMRAEQSAIIGKDEEGNWELQLPSGAALNFPVQEIGAEIEKRDFDFYS